MSPPLECREVETELAALLAGELPAGREAAVRVHVDGCVTCRAERDALAGVVAEVRAARRPARDPGELFFAGLAKRTAEQARVTPQARYRSGTAWFSLGLLAAAAATLLFAWPAGGHGRLFLAGGPTGLPGQRAAATPRTPIQAVPPAPAASGRDDDDDALPGDTGDPGDDTSDDTGWDEDGADDPTTAVDSLDTRQLESLDHELDGLIASYRRSPG